jgi:hypothetical protein
MRLRRILRTRSVSSGSYRRSRNEKTPESLSWGPSHGYLLKLVSIASAVFSDGLADTAV